MPSLQAPNALKTSWNCHKTICLFCYNKSMVENQNIAAPVPLPEGPATEHARNFSTAMGGFAGATLGALLGAAWGLAGRSSTLIRTASGAAVGAVVGMLFSSRTWGTPPRIQPVGPIADPDFAQDAGTEAPAQPSTPQHVAKLTAERSAPQADIAQAL